MCEMSAAAALSLGLCLVTVDKFKAIGKLTGENVFGGLLVLFLLALGAFLVSVAYLLFSRSPETPITTLIDELKGIVGTDQLIAEKPEQIKTIQKIDETPRFYSLLSFLSAHQGTALISDFKENHDGTTDEVTGLIAEAVHQGYVMSKENLLSLTAEGVTYHQAIADEMERALFFAKNVRD